MAITSTANRISYTGNGTQTQFTFPYVYYSQNDLLVYVNGTLQTLGSTYTVSPTTTNPEDGNPIGGAITFTTAPVNAATILIVRSLIIQQTIVLNDGSNFPAKTIEKTYDQIVMMLQQHDETLGRAVRVPIGEALDMTLPALSSRANQYLGFNSSGQPVALVAPSVSGTTVTSTGSTTARFLADRFADVINVKDYGATGNGTTDDTAAIQAAINAVPPTGGVVYLPAGRYKVTSGLVISISHVTFMGAGKYATTILFVPSSNNLTALTLSTGINQMIVQCAVRHLGFNSPDITSTKTAIKLVDNDIPTLEDIAIGPGGNWTGATSIGLRLQGRDLGVVRAMDIAADIPISIGVNPNNTISLDHFHFSDLYLMPSGTNPNISVDTGVNLTQITFDGHQAWVGGGYGFYWNDTTTTQVSNGLSFENVRWEQMTLPAGYMVYIHHNYGLQTLMIKGMYGGNTANGVSLRKVFDSRIDSLYYVGTATGFDADTSCNNLELIDVVFSNIGATVILTAPGVSGRYRIGGNVYALLPNAAAGQGAVQKFNASKTLGFSQLEPITFTIPANTIATFAANTLMGLVQIYGVSASVSAIAAVNGLSNSTRILVASDAGWFGAAVNAANYNLYWDAAALVYRLQNNTAFAATFYVVTMGQGER